MKFMLFFPQSKICIKFCSLGKSFFFIFPSKFNFSISLNKFSAIVLYKMNIYIYFISQKIKLKKNKILDLLVKIYDKHIKI